MTMKLNSNATASKSDSIAYSDWKLGWLRFQQVDPTDINDRQRIVLWPSSRFDHDIKSNWLNINARQQSNLSLLSQTEVNPRRSPWDEPLTMKSCNDFGFTSNLIDSVSSLPKPSVAAAKDLTALLHSMGLTKYIGKNHFSSHFLK